MRDISRAKFSDLEKLGKFFVGAMVVSILCVSAIKLSYTSYAHRRQRLYREAHPNIALHNSSNEAYVEAGERSPISDTVHLFIEGGDLNACKTVDYTTGVNAIVVTEQEKLTKFVEIGPNSNTYFAQLCLGIHTHHHSVLFSSKPKEQHGSSCNLFVSTTMLRPDRLNWDWKADSVHSNSLKLHTYTDEFKRESYSGALYVGVYSLTPNECEIEIQVSTYHTRELLSKAGLLRGGQVLLPRDVPEILRDE